jgi:hypothetical protein
MLVIGSMSECTLIEREDKMALHADFSLVQYENGVLAIGLAPPTAIGGMSLVWTLGKRPGGSTINAVRSVASGYNAQSGITITNSGEGQLFVSIYPVDTSGLDPGNYYYTLNKVDSGFATLMVDGFLKLGTNI